MNATPISTITEAERRESASQPRNLSPRGVSALFSFGLFQAQLLALSGLMMLLLIIGIWRSLPVSTDNIYPESAGVLIAQRWSQGAPLYGDYRQAPFLITAFPPLWYGVMALAAKSGFDSLDSLTLFGRIFSLITLGCAALLAYALNRRLGFSVRSALLSASLYLSLPLLIPWAVTARPDYLGVFLSALAIFWALKHGGAWICAAAMAAAAAFLTRHNAVAAPVTVVIWLAWSGRRRLAALFCGVWAVAVASVLAPFQFSTHLVALNLSGAKFGPIAATYVHDVLARLLASQGHGFAVALVVFGLLGWVVSFKEKDERIALLRIYLVVSGGAALVGSAAAGAAVNHFLEPALAMAFLVPAGLTHIAAEWRNGSAVSVLATMLTLALLAPSIDVQPARTAYLQPENLRRLTSPLRSRRVFTDDPYLAARTAAPMAVDLASLINTERVGGQAAWSSAELAQQLNAGSFEIVALRTPLEPPFYPYDPAALYPRAPRLDLAMQNAIAQKYRICFKLDGGEAGPLYIYGPRGSSPSAVDSECRSRTLDNLK